MPQPKTSTSANAKVKSPQNQKLPISAKISDLNERVEWFYGEDFNLDLAVSKYQEAVDLAKAIEKDLSELQNEIEIISKDFTKD